MGAAGDVLVAADKNMKAAERNDYQTVRYCVADRIPIMPRRDSFRDTIQKHIKQIKGV